MLTRLLFACLLCSGTLTLTAQPICLPDSMAIDTFISGFGVNPLPFDADENPSGGFQDTACINAYFETVVQVAIGDTATVGGTMIDLDSLELTDIQNLPAGLAYTCNPPNCRTYPDSFICATIYGTPTDMNDIGNNVLLIDATVYTAGFVVDVSYPDAALGANGVYNLVVKSAADCTTGTRDLTGVVAGLRNVPNPSTGLTDLTFDALEAGIFDLTVTDLFGRTVLRNSVAVTVGRNQLPIDGTDWSDGMYLYTLERAGRRASGRLVINR